ncbi:MAG: choice-of-anchor D domain-containing protein [Gammaproteobacteria bacterium]|nr:choice-of-anchor D domain-containing protein [Gammaproteobacteria bacterium]
MNWVPNADGFWDVATNWSSNPALPGTADDVTIDVGGATVRTITHQTGTDVINSLTSNEDLAVTGGALTINNAFSNTALTTLSGGTLLLNGVSSMSTLTHVGGLLTGTGTLTATGLSTLSGGTQSGTGTTIAQGGATLTNSSFALDGGRTLQLKGNSTASGSFVQMNLNGSDPNTGISAGGAGTLAIASGAVFDDQTTSFLQIVASNQGGTDTGASAVVNNAGTFRKSGDAAASSITTQFNNSGTVDVQKGVLTFNGDVTQHAANVLTGGKWKVSGTGVIDLNEPGAVDIVTNQGDVTLDGAAASFARINTLTTNQGAFRLLGNRNFTAGGAFINSGVLQLAGGTFGAPSLSNTGTGELFGFGTVTPTVLNSGLVRAAGGTLTVSGGIDGQSGTIQSDAGGTLVLGATSDGDFLVNNGNLNLGIFNVTVVKDYTNANFGVGNGFNARANVTGTGQIVASGNVAQALTGAVTNGTTATPSLAFGNIHLNDVVTQQYQVANTGTTGPSLRGALQTSVNGGNVTDGRLSGSGVTAANFGPLGTSTNSGNLDVTFTGNSAGALTNQKVAVVNNFDNVADQVLSLSGAVFRLASAGIQNVQPIDFGAFRVGDVMTAVDLAIKNTAANDGFSEKLTGSAGPADAGFSATGAFTLVGAQATNTGGIKVGLETTIAGAKVGTAKVNLVSDGTGTSNLGQTALTQQSVNLQGKVYAKAVAEVQTPSVDFGIVHIGETVTAKALTVKNNTTGALTDNLLGSVSAVPSGFTGAGSLGATGLAAGATSTALKVGLDTTNAGVFTGTATLAFASHDADLTDLSLANQSVAVAAQVNRFANPVLTKLSGAGTFTPNGTTFTYDFGTLVQGGAGVLGSLNLTNLISGPADVLGATFSVGSGPLSLTGFDNFTGLNAGAAHSLSASFDPLVVGTFEQVVQINLFGDNASGFHGGLGSFTVTFKGAVSPSTVPLPAAVWLLGSGLLGLWGTRRRRAT